MRKEFIIKSNNEISQIFKNGKRYQSKNLIVIVSEKQERHDLNGRVAFIAGKRLGNAVVRNRTKRILRAAADECNLPLADKDLLLVANQRTTASTSQQCTESLRRVLSQIERDR